MKSTPAILAFLLLLFQFKCMIIILITSTTKAFLIASAINYTYAKHHIHTKTKYSTGQHGAKIQKQQQQRTTSEQQCYKIRCSCTGKNAAWIQLKFYNDSETEPDFSIQFGVALAILKCKGTWCKKASSSFFSSNPFFDSC